METIIWKRIPNYSLYEASTNGDIKTFNWKNKGYERIMKPALDANGYYRTMLKSDEGKWATVKVHRIIAQTFLENPNNKPQVNHLNCVRSDNRISNLEWCTISENVKHSYDYGKSNSKGQYNSCASLTDQQVIEIRSNYQYGRKSRHEGGLTKKQIAEKYNTTYSVIKRIVHNKTWKHLL